MPTQPVVARVQVVTGCEAVVLVCDSAGAWRPWLKHTGPDAAERCEQTRAELEAGVFDTAGRLPERARRPARAPSSPWTVDLPASLRPLFESLALANGGTAEQQVGHYLEADGLLVDLARQAARSSRSA